MPVRIITIVALFLAFLVAAPVTAYLYAQSTVSTDVRITARLLENGKVEFGLQQRVDGEWGETILPRVNKFPYATAAVDRWLFSSPVTVEAEVPITAEEPEGAPPAPEEDAPPPASTGAWQRLTGSSASGDYVAYGLDDLAHVGRLSIGCWSDGSQSLFILTDEFLLNDIGTDDITVRYRVAGGAPQTAQWWSDEDWEVGATWQSTVGPLWPREEDAFVRWLYFSASTSTTFYFSVTDYFGDSYAGTFDLTGLFVVLENLTCFNPGG